MGSKREVVARVGGVGLLTTAIMPLLYVAQVGGLLVSKLGISAQVAGAIAAALTSGGAAAVIAVWPFVAPFIGTMEVILAVWGTAAVVGF
jgi:hypothetical protein